MISYLIQHNIERIVIDDVGGDIVDNISKNPNFSEKTLGTDEKVLIFGLVAASIFNLEIEINIFGPGCDGHKIPSEVV